MSGVDALRWATNAAFLGLVVIGFRAWWQHRHPAVAWMTATFASIGLVILASLVLPDHPHGAAVIGQRLLVAVLLLFPYLLFRFAASFERASRGLEATVGILTAVVIVWTFVLPSFPASGEPRSTQFQAYVIAVLISWGAISVVVAVRLWNAGRAEPRLARRRMRLLATATAVMGAALVVSGSAGGGGNGAVTAVTQLIALTSAALFFVGYSPPALLRVWWRRPEERAVREAELALLSATTTEAVTSILLPAAMAVVGARGTALVGHDGLLVDSSGSFSSSTDAALPRRPASSDTDVVAVETRSGDLVVATSPYAPVFGDEELDLLRALGVVADLALERAALLEREREAKADLERSNEELEQFAYVASHDLKQPLRVITGFAELLEKRYREQLDETGVEYLDYLTGASDRMQRLIDDLLQLSRIGRSEEEYGSADLEEVVEEALANLAPEIDELAATVDVGHLPPARGSQRLLIQVFQNLIGNAIKYSGRGCVVNVRGTAQNGTCRYSVVDHGPGIDPEHAERIFLPFNRLVGEDGPSGTGIGLAIVKKVVDLHGGRVWVEPHPEGGSVFRFTLPMAR